jgi:hypothetical protein
MLGPEDFFQKYRKKRFLFYSFFLYLFDCSFLVIKREISFIYISRCSKTKNQLGSGHRSATAIFIKKLHHPSLRFSIVVPSNNWIESIQTTFYFRRKIHRKWSFKKLYLDILLPDFGASSDVILLYIKSAGLTRCTCRILDG